MWQCNKIPNIQVLYKDGYPITPKEGAVNEVHKSECFRNDFHLVDLKWNRRIHIVEKHSTLFCSIFHWWMTQFKNNFKMPLTSALNGF